MTESEYPEGWVRREAVLAAFDQAVGRAWLDPQLSPADALKQARDAIAAMDSSAESLARLRQRVDQLERDLTQVGDRVVALRDTVEAIVERFDVAWERANTPADVQAALTALIDAPGRLRDKLKGAK